MFRPLGERISLLNATIKNYLGKNFLSGNFSKLTSVKKTGGFTLKEENINTYIYSTSFSNVNILGSVALPSAFVVTLLS